jgi:hypothetical protein
VKRAENDDEVLASRRHFSLGSSLQKRTTGVSDNPMAEELLTPEDIATWLRVKPAWVRAHANGNRKPKLPSLKMGAFRRFRRQDIQSFLEELAKGAR